MIKLRISQVCPKCLALGTVSTETLVAAETVTLRWCCKTCGRWWRISDDDIKAYERLLGSYLLARRATRADPTAALRSEKRRVRLPA